MRVYEGIFIFSPESTPDHRKNQDTLVTGLVQKFSGQVVNITELGKKALGYYVQKFKEGFFVVVEFKMAPEKMVEFDQALRLQNEILKFMLTVKQEVKAKVVKQKSVKVDKKPVAPVAAKA